MRLLSRRPVAESGRHRPARAVAILALGLMVFSAGLRAFHSHPIPAEERSGAALAEASKTHTKGCCVCVASTPHVVLDPRTPTLAPPCEASGALATLASALAAGPAEVGRPIRAPPSA